MIQPPSKKAFSIRTHNLINLESSYMSVSRIQISSDNETPCLNVDTAHLLRNKMEQNACLVYTKHIYYIY